MLYDKIMSENVEKVMQRISNFPNPDRKELFAHTFCEYLAEQLTSFVILKIIPLDANEG